MGVGFTYHCNECGQDYIANIGAGFFYPQACEEALASVKAGKFGEKLKTAALSEKHTGCAPEAKIYKCEDCGCWDVFDDVSVYGWADKKRDIEISNIALWTEDAKDYSLIERFIPKCEKCGGDMHAIDVDEDCGAAPQLNCNKCGSPLVEQPEMISWD